MDMSGLLVFLVVGAFAGWLASVFIKGSGYGLLSNILIGIVGAFIGNALFDILGLAATGLLGSIIVATVGAWVLLFAVRLVKRL